VRILLSRAPYTAHCSLRRAHTARAAVPGLRPSQRRPSAGSPALRRAPVQASAGLRPGTPCPRAPVQASAGLRPGTPCPVPAFGRHSVPQCRPVPAFGRHSRAPVQAVPAFGRALRAPVPAFGRHSVPPMKASAGLRPSAGTPCL